MIGVVLSYDDLLEIVLAHAIGANSRLHGVEHWRRVHDVGLELAAQTPGADPEVVAAFAVFHDALRVSDGVDPYHGARGSRLAGALVTWLDRDQLRKLLLACSTHTDGSVSADPTIGCCYDADRLDLPRCGITVDERLLSTEAARKRLST
jgi:uncharacterized protein